MKKNKDRSFWFWLGSLALLGGAAVYWMSAPYGLGLAADSIAYMQAAKQVLLGGGLNQAGNVAPAGNYPPGFSLILSAAWFVGLSFVEWARLLNVVFFSGSIFLAGSLVFYVRHSRFAVLVTALALMTSVHIVQAHGRLDAEPLFLFVVLAWFRMLLSFVNTGSRRALYAAAFCAGFSVLTGYAGLALVMAGVSWLWFKGRAEGRTRDAILFLTAALILPLVWFVRNAVLTGNMMGESLNAAVRFADRLAIAVNGCSELLLPSRVPWVVRWVVLAAGLILLLKWLKGHCQCFVVEVKRPVSLAVFFCAAYLLFGLSGRVLLHGGSVLDHQALVPVYGLLSLLLGLMVPDFFCPVQAGGVCQPWTLCRKMAVLVLIGFFALALVRSVNLAGILYKNGSGYSSRLIGSSKLAETLRSIDDRVPLYSNDPAAVYFFAGRPAVYIPGQGEKNFAFPPPEAVADDFAKERAVAVIFSPADFHPGKAWERASAALGLKLLFKDDFGSILGVGKK